MSIFIRFERNYNNIIYSDTLVLPDDHAKTSEEIEQMKEARFQQWVYNRENPLVDTSTEEIPPSVDDSASLEVPTIT